MLQAIKSDWSSLRDHMLKRHLDVQCGRMMSAEALTNQGKVFVFFSQKGGLIGLGCRVGRQTDVSRLSLTDWQHLAPFKTKPPMRDWIVVGAADRERWLALAELCLTISRKRKT